MCSAARPCQANEAGGGGGGRGGDVALNSLLMASLSLKLSLSRRALKQLEMAKLRVSF